MLIPAECHNTEVRVDPSLYQWSGQLVPTVAKSCNLFLGSQHEREKGKKKKRKISIVLKDSTELSDEAMAYSEKSENLDNLLCGLFEAY